MAQQNTTQQGFSLTELMIVVAIIGVLAAIGLPAYQNYARQAKRADAHNALTTISNLEERYFTEHNSYTKNPTDLGYDSNTPDSNEGYWQLSITAAAAATGYTISAAPANGHIDGDCNAITLNALGAKAPATCW